MPSGISTPFYYQFVTPCSQHSSAAQHRKRFLRTVQKQVMPSGNPPPTGHAGNFTNTRLQLRESPGSLAQTGAQHSAGHAAGRAFGAPRGTPRLPPPLLFAPARPRRSMPDSRLPHTALAAALPAPPARTARRSEARPPRLRAPSASLTSPLWQLELAALPPAAGAAGRARGPPQRSMGHRVHKPWARRGKHSVRLQLPRGFAAAARRGPGRSRLAGRPLGLRRALVGAVGGSTSDLVFINVVL